MSTDTAFAPTAADRAAYAVLEGTPPTQVAHLSGAGVQLAADGGDMLTGIAVVKPGFYNGYFEVTRDDLDAWVARFDELTASGTFRPPMRLDHSWDVLSVIGRFVALRVENRPDKSIGDTVVPMLVGDVRLVGTKAENAKIIEWIKSGKLDERSSEFYPYRTNNGVDYPSIFAGCAFVDIPAVEGLSAITLHRATLTSNGTDTPEGTTVSTTTEQPTVTEGDPVVEAPAVETPPAPVEDAPVLGDEPVVEGEDEAPAGEVPADLAAALAAVTGVTLTAAQTAALSAEVDRRVALRVEADTRIATFKAKGVVPLALADTVEALLRHPDATVRDGVASFLDFAKPPVKLRAQDGAAALEPVAVDGVTSPAELLALDTDEEFADEWAALTSEQRKTPEYKAAYAARFPA